MQIYTLDMFQEIREGPVGLGPVARPASRHAIAHRISAVRVHPVYPTPLRNPTVDTILLKKAHCKIVWYGEGQVTALRPLLIFAQFATG